MQKFFQLIPSGTNIQFIRHRWRFIIVSIVMISMSLGVMVWRQVTTGQALNYGIDFAGGSQVRLALSAEQDPGVETLREALVEFGYAGSSVVAVPEAEHEVMVRVKEVVSIDDATLATCENAAKSVSGAAEGTTANAVGFNHPEGGSKFFLKYDAEPNYREVERVINDAGCEGTADRGFGGKIGEFPVDFALIGVGSKIQEEIDAKFGEDTVLTIVRAETVGAKVGSQLKEDGAKAMVFALAFIFLYVMIRFDLRFAPGGILALAHDATLVIGAFALTGREFNLQTIAAVLTVVGYSINDTIVVFDRVRERVALYRDEPIEETANTALNETLSRTILTSGTTLIVVLTIFLFGSGTIKDFAFALLVGVGVGTYSSLYVATPVFLWVNHRFYAGKGHLKFLDKSGAGTGALLGVGTDGPPQAPDGELSVDALSDVEPEAGKPEAGPRTGTRRRRRRRPD